VAAQPRADIFYIVKRGSTWDFLQPQALQSACGGSRLPGLAVFKPPAIGSISMKIWS
jgi:hypothetical protein